MPPERWLTPSLAKPRERAWTPGFKCSFSRDQWQHFDAVVVTARGGITRDAQIWRSHQKQATDNAVRGKQISINTMAKWKHSMPCDVLADVVIGLACMQSLLRHSRQRLRHGKRGIDIGVKLLVSGNQFLIPETLEGFRHRPGLDYGKPYEINSIRVFSGEGWTNLYPPFPKTMNGCHKGWYVVRWRSQNPNVIIESATGYHGDIRMRQSVAPPATKGIMQGSNCTEPLFKFSRTKNGNSSTLTDVVYEIKF